MVIGKINSLREKELDHLISGRELQMIIRGVQLESCLKGTKLDSFIAKLPRHSFCPHFQEPDFEAFFNLLLEHQKPIDHTETDWSMLLGFFRRIDF